MEKTRRAWRFFRALTLFWTAFIGVGALVGSAMFFFSPQDGFVMGEILPILRERMPFGELLFSNFIFSGISLLIVNGLSNLTAFALILRGKRAGYIMGWVFGITLMLWIGIQFYCFAPEVYAIDIAFCLFGLLQFICGYLAYVYFSKLQFKLDMADYPNIGKTDGTAAVIFFSREGYAKKLACEKADELGCRLIELTTGEPTQGISGFWWCGRFGMHGWGMSIDKIDIPQDGFDRVYIFSPVWVFGICSPVRQFLKEHSESIGSAELTLTHFMRSPLKGVFREPKHILGDKLTFCRSVCTRFGQHRKSVDIDI